MWEECVLGKADIQPTMCITNMMLSVRHGKHHGYLQTQRL